MREAEPSPELMKAFRALLPADRRVFSAGMVNRKEIRRRRKENKWSYADAAEHAGWGAEHRARWQHVETGQSPDPRVSTLEGMAKAFGCTVNDLLSPAPARRPGRRR